MKPSETKVNLRAIKSRSLTSFHRATPQNRNKPTPNVKRKAKGDSLEQRIIAQANVSRLQHTGLIEKAIRATLPSSNAILDDDTIHVSEIDKVAQQIMREMHHQSHKNRDQSLRMKLRQPSASVPVVATSNSSLCDPIAAQVAILEQKLILLRKELANMGTNTASISHLPFYNQIYSSIANVRREINAFIVLQSHVKIIGDMTHDSDDEDDASYLIRSRSKTKETQGATSADVNNVVDNVLLTMADDLDIEIIDDVDERKNQSSSASQHQEVRRPDPQYMDRMIPAMPVLYNNNSHDSLEDNHFYTDEGIHQIHALLDGSTDSFQLLHGGNYQNYDRATYLIDSISNNYSNLNYNRNNNSETSNGLSQNEFGSLPSCMLPKGIILTSKCSICLLKQHEQQQVIVLPCNHIFHSACLREWLARAKSCPLCKQCVQ